MATDGNVSIAYHIAKIVCLSFVITTDAYEKLNVPSMLTTTLNVVERLKSYVLFEAKLFLLL